MIDYSIRRRHSIFKDPKPKPINIPSDTVQLASLSAIMTIIVTVVYMILYIIYIVGRFTQNTSIDNLNGSYFFVHILSEVYVKEHHSVNGLPDSLTKSFTIFKLVMISIALSLFSLFCAGRLLWSVYDKKQSHCFINMVYLTILPFLLILAVDSVFVFCLGWDYDNLSCMVDRNVAGDVQNYTKDIARLVALFLITIALKGYVLYVIQAIFLTMLVVKAYQMDVAMEPTFNRMSILKAYETGPDKERREAERQQREINYLKGLKKMPLQERTEQAVSDFGISRQSIIDDDISYYSTRSFEPMANNRQLVPAEVQWHRDDDPSTSRAITPTIQPVSIPPPDYSPETRRRLKPALKSSYQT